MIYGNNLESRPCCIVNYNKGEMAAGVRMLENQHYNGGQITLDALDSYEKLFLVKNSCTLVKSSKIQRVMDFISSLGAIISGTMMGFKPAQ